MGLWPLPLLLGGFRPPNKWAARTGRDDMPPARRREAAPRCDAEQERVARQHEWIDGPPGESGQPGSVYGRAGEVRTGM